MGLGAVNNTKSKYLSIAGGFIWDKKAEKTDPNYATQEYEKADKSKHLRAGARYQDLTGMIIGVTLRTHDEYGDSLNVVVKDGEESYTISLGIDNRYCGDFMKALLVFDMEKPLFIKPYDFIGTNKKRAMGISFRQDGEKLNLRIDDSPMKDAEWFKTAEKREIKRFFEDVTDYFKDRIKAEILPLFEGQATDTEQKPTEAVAETPPASTATEETKNTAEKIEILPTPLKMKAFLKTYIAENYAGKQLPKLDKAGVIQWYSLAIELESLPFPKEVVVEETSQSDVDAQLEALI